MNLLNANTIQGQYQIVGKQVVITLEGFLVNCRVIDAKTAYGNVRLLVSPLSGQGQKWIDVSRVKEVK